MLYYRKARSHVYHISKKKRGLDWYQIPTLEVFMRLFYEVKKEAYINNDGVLRFGKLKVLDDGRWRLLISPEQAKLYWQQEGRWRAY